VTDASDIAEAADPAAPDLARRLGASVAFVAAGTAIVLLRQPGFHSWSTLWAEDGAVYANDTLHLPALSTVTRPYAGYVQVVPRLLALPIRLMPVSWYAPWFAIAGAVVTALLGLMVVHSAAGWIDNRGLRWLLGLVLVTTPTITYEINADVVNLIWVLLAVSFWVIASRRRGPAETGLRGVVLLLAALSTPVTAIMVPFAVVVTALRRTWEDATMLGSLLVGLGLQAALVHGAPTPVEVSQHDYGQATHSFFVRVLGSMVVGEKWLPDLFPTHNRSLIVLAVTVVVAIVVASRVWRLRFDRAWLVAGAVLTGVGAFVAIVVGRGTNFVPLLYAGRYAPADARYMYVPIFLLLSAIFVMVDASHLDWLMILVSIWVVVVTVSSLGVGGPRSVGPAWAVGVRQAQVTCRAHPAQADVLIPISPIGWRATIPCSRLR
jgi:hypothetical protein